MKKKILPIIIILILCLSSSISAQETITIKDYLEMALPPHPGRKIVLDPNTGLLTITDTPSNHKLIRELIKEFDIGVPQVMIEARFVEVSMTDVRELGIQWYWQKEGATGSREYLHTGDIAWGLEDEAGTYLSFPQQDRGLDLRIGKIASAGELRAYLHALEQKGKANLLSAPQVTTHSGQTANMQVSKTFPYVASVTLENKGTSEFPTWVLTQHFEEVSIGISLDVVPHVAAKGDLITLDLHPIVNELITQRSIKPTVEGVDYPGVPDEVGWPVIDTRSTQTSIIIRSGQTIVLGGFIKEDDKTYTRKVPLLGDIPLLGNLFKYDYVNKEKRNLLIFITAKLITEDGEILR
jgi:type II secretory pathway component GspD/PulD (secretin)